jgi:glycosyltransferase involved in cell wall biosynthesis
MTSLIRALTYAGMSGEKIRDKLSTISNILIISRSGLFDERYYLANNPDVAAGKFPAIYHFTRFGGFEGRPASDRFDAGFYLKANPDVLQSGKHPLVHFAKYGLAEARAPIYKASPPKAKQPAPESSPPWDTRLMPSVTWPVERGVLPRKMYIVPAVLGERNTTRYRVNHLKEMASGFVEVEVIDIYNPPTHFYLDIDVGDCVVVLQRVPMGNQTIRSFFQKVKESPSILVYEIDDQIFDAGQLEDWRISGLAHKPDSYQSAMSYADHFIVSTTALRNRIDSRFGKPVHIVHNCLNSEIISASANARSQREVSGQKFVIGYASGSSTHDADLNAALPSIIRFLRDYPLVEFRCIGAVTLPSSMMEEFGSRIIIQPPVNWRDLPSVLASFTIQIIPLAYSKFNKFKSHIRFLESAAVGVPVIASNFGEQAATIIPGHTGELVKNSEDAWYEALVKMYTDTEFRDRLAERARAYVLKYWCTDSAFRLDRLKHILGDLGLGVLRDKISIILVTYNPIYDVKEVVESLYKNTSVPFELLVWNNSSDADVKNYLHGIEAPNCMVIDVEQNVGKAKGANYLFKVAAERFVCGADDDYIFPQHWDVRMLTAAKSVPSLGWLSTNLSKNSSGMRDIGRIDGFKGGSSAFYADGVGGWVVFTSATARERLGFYREHGLYGGIDGDYNRRARRAGLYTGYVRTVVGQHKINRLHNPAWELFKQKIQEEMRIHGKDSDAVTSKFRDFFSTENQSLEIAIKICTPIIHDENVWGDTHFARGLKSALEGLDYAVRIDKHEEWYPEEEAANVVIHLFGLHKYKPDPKRINILWVISHTDLIDREFLESFDYIFCASDAVALRARAMVPDIHVETLHQCTDLQVFFPDGSTHKDIDVAFVGNSRRIYRDAVRYAVEMGLNVSVWGTKWEEFIDKKFIKGQALSSTAVAEVYRRSKVVLNDHWDDQKVVGLVNNRVFDVLSCGTMVLSDENAGIDEIFGVGQIPTFNDGESFERELSHLLANDEDRRQRTKALAENVRNKHTFKQRALAINSAILFVIENYVTYKSELKWAKQQEKAQAGDRVSLT